MTAPTTEDETKASLGPLGGGWTAVTIVIGVMAALIALGGMVLSFRAVSQEMTPAFGARWAWLVPIVVDLTVFVFSGVDLVLSRLDMSHPLARWTVYGATAGTVYLNGAAGGTLPGRIAHVLMPSIWVVFVELMRHVVRRQVNLATASHREPVPVARWLLSPWPTMKLWRRMVLWRENSYPKALQQERRRLARIAHLRDDHGRWWRWRVSALEKLDLSLGDTPEGPTQAATPQPQSVTAADRATAKPTTAGHDDTPTVRDTTPPAPRPRVPRPATPRTANATPLMLPLIDRDADAAALLAAGPPEWHTLKKAEAMRRVDELLPGRTASQVVSLLATRGVTVTPVDVRKTRQRTREAAASQAAEPEPESDGLDDELSA